MKLTKLVPNVFYTDINVGLDLFVGCLGFQVRYSDLAAEQPFCVIEKDNLKLYVIQNETYALKDRPEIRIETDDIEAAYKEVRQRKPELLHPNLNKVTLRAWGAQEFALLDASGVCIVMQQW